MWFGTSGILHFSFENASELMFQPEVRILITQTLLSNMALLRLDLRQNLSIIAKK
jgi:hypothetical protein